MDLTAAVTVMFAAAVADLATASSDCSKLILAVMFVTVTLVAVTLVAVTLVAVTLVAETSASVMASVTAVATSNN